MGKAVMRLLYIDDEPRQMVFFVEFLKFRGIDVEMGDLADNYDIIADGPLGFDALITDLMMPPVEDIGPQDGFTTGIDVAVTARTHFKGPIAIASLAFPPDRSVIQQCRQHNIEYFHKRELGKDIESLIDFIRGH